MHRPRHVMHYVRVLSLQRIDQLLSGFAAENLLQAEEVGGHARVVADDFLLARHAPQRRNGSSVGMRRFEPGHVGVVVLVVQTCVEFVLSDK